MERLVDVFDGVNVYRNCAIVVICIGSMVLSMALDLVSGVMKARKLGIARTSIGFKRTVDKGRKYIGPFICLVLIDFMCFVIIPFPLFSILWSCYCVFCEFVSLREKSWEKDEIRRQEKTLNVIVDNKDDIARMFVEVLKKVGGDEVDKGFHDGGADAERGGGKVGD